MCAIYLLRIILLVNNIWTDGHTNKRTHGVRNFHHFGWNETMKNLQITVLHSIIILSSIGVYKNERTCYGDRMSAQLEC